jgi:hypothetical protein
LVPSKLRSGCSSTLCVLGASLLLLVVLLVVCPRLWLLLLLLEEVEGRW